MRLGDLDKYINLRKKLDKRFAVYYGFWAGIVTFILFIFSNFLTGIMAGAIVFVVVFLIIYIMRTIVNGGIDKRRSEVENSDPMIDVTFRGEGGLLVIHENSIEYVNLTKFSQHKIPVLETNEDLFIATGPIEFNKLQKLKFGDTKMCQITIKEMPHGTHYGYYFYDVDGKLNREVEALDKVNKFNNEKYQ